MKAGKAKTVSKRLGLLLNSAFGRNSPVKSTMSVDRMVSAGTVKAASKPRKMVLSKNFAISMPYTTKAILLPTNIALTKLLG